MLKQEPCLTVSQITEMIQAKLESGFSSVVVEGEISNFRPSSTGHIYFTLKDSNAVLAAVLFRGVQNSLRFKPADGMQVRIRGRISVYAKRGTYQLICENIDNTGAGEILLLLEERKQRLAAEGLFDPSRKKPIPAFPSSVAVITSPTGAAIRDILQVLQRRNCGIRLIILPAAVQGDEAALQITEQICIANAYQLAEVLIVGRGGGSLEDLLPFSEECVVRAIAQSEIPVISAVGHEIDFSLSDFAADLRAPTPSAAAEMVSKSREEVIGWVASQLRQMQLVVYNRMERCRILLKHFGIENLQRYFQSVHQSAMMQTDDYKTMLALAMREKLQQYKQRLQLALAELNAHSPTAILSRGYSIVTELSSRNIVRNIEQLQTGAAVDIQFSIGKAQAVIETITADHKPTD